MPSLLATRCALLALVAGLLTLGAPVAQADEVGPSATSVTTATYERAGDIRRKRGLFVDPLMPAAQQGPAYATIAKKPQALWFSNEYYPTKRVRTIAARYVARAARARKTPMLVVYSIPDRDCGQYSSGGLPGGRAYKRWITQLARGIKGSKPMVVLEPDAIPFYGHSECRNSTGRLSLLRFATRTLARAGAWVYLDAGHSDWTPYAGRALLLKKAGVGYARGFSTNVSNFRRSGAEKRYAGYLVRQLRKLNVRGVKYVIDTSRNGAANPVSGDVINPTWARIGTRPRLVFKGAFDGTLWVKHPGESDGPVNGGPSSGQWCDLLADRLLGRPDSGGC
ncbi:MAG: glycoside hydrolase family 6 protein [Nocardioides sp.]|nr:glycoside hydrolase family 6 protein [Nocardioides sp.]